MERSPESGPSFRFRTCTLRSTFGFARGAPGAVGTNAAAGAAAGGATGSSSANAEGSPVRGAAHDRPAVAVRTSETAVLDAVATLVPGRWTHLAGTYDGAVLRIYVDGAPAGERPLSGALRDPAVPLRIGAGSGATPESPFHGEIDDVRLYGRALSAPEIRALAAVEAQDAAAPSHDGRNGDGGLNDRLCGALGWEGLLALLARRRRTSARRAFRAT